MTIEKILAQAVKKLKDKNIASAILDAEVLLSFVLKKTKEFILTYPDKKITKRQAEKFKSLISRRAKNEPVAYLTGHQEFYGLDFKTNQNVLIPRPETELLIDEIIYFTRGQIQNTTYKILDIGTGSGAIAITLKKYLPKCKITATDISKKALATASKNALNNQVKVEFIQSDLLQNLKNKKIDIIAANLPYLDKTEMKEKSIQHEPKEALYGGDDGLDLYRKLFKQIKELKYQPQFIICEIGDAHAKKARAIAQKIFSTKTIKIKKDLCGLKRFLIII